MAARSGSVCVPVRINRINAFNINNLYGMSAWLTWLHLTCLPLFVTYSLAIVFICVLYANQLSSLSFFLSLFRSFSADQSMTFCWLSLESQGRRRINRKSPCRVSVRLPAFIDQRTSIIVRRSVIGDRWSAINDQWSARNAVDAMWPCNWHLAGIWQLFDSHRTFIMHLPLQCSCRDYWSQIHLITFECQINIERGLVFAKIIIVTARGIKAPWKASNFIFLCLLISWQFDV